MSSNITHNNEPNSTHHHEPTIKEPIYVFLALVLLTITTVALSGTASNAIVSVGIALIIASIKGFLVIRYFMHIKYEPLVFKKFIGVAIFTMLTIYALLFTDYLYRSL